MAARPLHPLLLGAMLLAAGVGAQTSDPGFNGEWIIEMRDPHGVAMRGADNIVLQLDGPAGSYQNLSANMLQSNTCGRVKADVEKVSADADRLEFTVVRSRKLPGCVDFRLAFRRDGDKLVGKVMTAREGADPTTYVARRR